jgi:hypothetical protein
VFRAWWWPGGLAGCAGFHGLGVWCWWLVGLGCGWVVDLGGEGVEFGVSVGVGVVELLLGAAEEVKRRRRAPTALVTATALQRARR